MLEETARLAAAVVVGVAAARAEVVVGVEAELELAYQFLWYHRLPFQWAPTSEASLFTAKDSVLIRRC